MIKQLLLSVLALAIVFGFEGAYARGAKAKALETRFKTVETRRMKAEIEKLKSETKDQAEKDIYEKYLKSGSTAELTEAKDALDILEAFGKAGVKFRSLEEGGFDLVRVLTELAGKSNKSDSIVKITEFLNALPKYAESGEVHSRKQALIIESIFIVRGHVAKQGIKELKEIQEHLGEKEFAEAQKETLELLDLNTGKNLEQKAEAEGVKDAILKNNPNAFQDANILGTARVMAVAKVLERTKNMTKDKALALAENLRKEGCI